MCDPSAVISNVTIRLARRADAAEIARMSRDDIEYGLPWSWTEARIARAIEDPDTKRVLTWLRDLFGLSLIERDLA